MDLIRSAVLILALHGFESAEPPRAVVTGPRTGVAGDIIRLDISKSVGDVFKVKCRPERFTDGRPTLDTEDPKKPIIASRPGVYIITVIAANADGIDDTEFTVTIAGGVTPDPVKPDNPPQPPAPQPTIPPEKNKLGLANLGYTQCVANLTAADKSIVAEIADGYSAIRSQIAAGTITTMSDMNAKILAKNRAATGDQKDRFGQALIIPLAKHMGTLGLKTPADHLGAFDEISFGLYLFAR